MPYIYMTSDNNFLILMLLFLDGELIVTDFCFCLFVCLFVCLLPGIETLSAKLDNCSAMAYNV